MNALPEVAFHSGMADKAAYLFRLLRKVRRAGHRVRVGGEAAQLDRLDGYLWAVEPGEFMPHARARRGQAPDPNLAAVTPIWLADADSGPPPCDVFVNLGPDTDSCAAAHTRVIELVSLDDDDRRSARARWRHYEALGWPLTHHLVGGADVR